MKITDQIYADVKKLLNNGVSIDEISNLSGASIRTIYRINQSDSFNNYKKIACNLLEDTNIKQNWFNKIIRKFR